MRTRLPLFLVLPLFVLATACCTTTPEGGGAVPPPEGGKVAVADWESAVPIPPPAGKLPRFGTMTTAGSVPLTARERQDEAASLRRANQNLMDEVAKLMSELESVRAGRMASATAAPESPRLEPAAPAARVEMGKVREALRHAGAADLVVTRNHDRLVVVRLNGSMAFASGKAVLTPAARAKIRQVGSAVAREFPGIRLRVEGHTDSDPIRKSKWESNAALSLARAGAVAEYLAQTSGIGADRIETAGYGAERPIASNETREGKAKNRRVELVLVE